MKNVSNQQIKIRWNNVYIKSPNIFSLLSVTNTVRNLQNSREHTCTHN